MGSYDKAGAIGALAKGISGFTEGYVTGKKMKLEEQEAEDRKAEREQRRLDREAGAIRTQKDDAFKEKSNARTEADWEREDAERPAKEAEAAAEADHKAKSRKNEEATWLTPEEIAHKKKLAAQQEKIDSHAMALDAVLSGQPEMAPEILNNYAEGGPKVKSVSVQGGPGDPNPQMQIVFENGQMKYLPAKQIAASNQKVDDMLVAGAQKKLSMNDPLTPPEFTAIKNSLLYSYSIPELDKIKSGSFPEDIIKADRVANLILYNHYENMRSGMNEDESAKKLGLKLRNEAQKTKAEIDWTLARDRARGMVGTMTPGKRKSNAADAAAAKGAITEARAAKVAYDAEQAALPPSKRIGDILPARANGSGAVGSAPAPAQGTVDGIPPQHYIRANAPAGAVPPDDAAAPAGAVGSGATTGAVQPMPAAPTQGTDAVPPAPAVTGQPAIGADEPAAVDADNNGVLDNTRWPDPITKEPLDMNKIVNFLTMFEALPTGDPRRTQYAAQYEIDKKRKALWLKSVTTPAQ